MSFWIFGYGSLIFDGWETRYSCRKRQSATLEGYARSFLKPSVKNWGTPARPGPTLCLLESSVSQCRGVAFEFDDAQESVILAYLRKREGRGFDFVKERLRLDSDAAVDAYVSAYHGERLKDTDFTVLAEMALRATGTSGRCADYILRLRAALSSSGISDPTVDALSDLLLRLQSKSKAGN